MDARQTNTLVAFGVAVFFWVLPGVLALFRLDDSTIGAWLGARVPEAVAALIGAMLLFVLPDKLRQGTFTVTWDEAVRIAWGTILVMWAGLRIICPLLGLA
jgi:sodium-dependent dicarboxylate transporter 2/3/5